MPLSNLRLGSSSSAPPTPTFPIPIPSSSTSTSPSHPAHHSVSGIFLQLDSSELVFRAFAGDESNGESVELSGSLTVQLAESTSLKHIALVLRAIARFDYLDPLSGKRYHQDHNLFTHHAHFLPLCSDSTHTHTLQAGAHHFPFSLRLPPGLPASLRTYSGSGAIYYKLKAVASRAGFLAAGKWETKRLIRVSRSFPAEAVEWSQTLDIENTWPGKISYEISLPRKAFAAGETIPVTIKFTPLMKGVRVTSLVITIKEHVTILTKPGNAPHVENRDVAEYRFEFKSGSSEPASRASEPGTSAGTLTTTDLRLLTRRLQAVSVANEDWRGGRSRAVSMGTGVGVGAGGTGVGVNVEGEGEGEESLSGELSKVLGISLPASTTPSHPLAPITVNHKLRFSAFISNPDGHTSELRCALPLYVLAAELATETLLAAGGGGSNPLVFGPSGALVSSVADGPAELPSYPEHVRDRLAPLASAAVRPALIPAPWSVATTPAGSPPLSPIDSRRSSLSHGYFPTMTRWNDPELLRSLDPTADADAISRGRSSQTSSRASSRGPSPTPHSNGKYPLRLPKALTRMAQQLTAVATTNSSHNHNNTTTAQSRLIMTAMGGGASSNPQQPLGSHSTITPQTQAVLVDSGGGNQLESAQVPVQVGQLVVGTDEMESEEVLSRVPSYSVASLGSLGGGPVPISSLIGLPAYEDSV